MLNKITYSLTLLTLGITFSEGADKDGFIMKDRHGNGDAILDLVGKLFGNLIP